MATTFRPGEAHEHRRRAGTRARTRWRVFIKSTCNGFRIEEAADDRFGFKEDVTGGFLCGLGGGGSGRLPRLAPGGMHGTSPGFLEGFLIDRVFDARGMGAAFLGV